MTEPPPMEKIGRKFSFNPQDIRILVVDDDRTTVLVARKLLNKAGYLNVVTASDGVEALELFTKSLKNKDEKFHLILSDMYMPRMDGLQLLKEARKLTEDVPVIMMSATEDLDFVYKCLQEGADSYILKPIREDQLRNVWQNLYRKRKEKKVLQELTSEKNRSSLLETKTAQLEEDISNLRIKVDKAVEIPIKIISEEISKLLQQNLPEEISSPLKSILRQMHKIDLYQPAFQKFLKSDANMDPETKQWLVDELGTSDPDDTTQNTPRPGDTIFGGGWPELSSEATNKTHDFLRSWDFNVWQHQEKELLPYAEEIFDEFNLLSRFQVPRDKFRNFLMQVAERYPKKNPYHNFRHAFDVLHTIYIILWNDAANLLSYLEIFCLFISALTHDIDHPGCSNPFLINTCSKLAMRYNDRSVLENYHSSFTFSLISQSQNNIFIGLTEEQRREARSLIISSILSTDLAHHMEILGKFKTVVSNGFSKDSKEHRALLLEILIKCADISNPGKPFNVAKYWAQMIQEEFFIQGDMEKERGLKISPFMDREKPALARMQLNFIEFLVIPLFTELGKLLPKCEFVLNQLQENKKVWHSFLEQEARENH